MPTAHRTQPLIPACATTHPQLTAATCACSSGRTCIEPLPLALVVSLLPAVRRPAAPLMKAETPARVARPPLVAELGLNCPRVPLCIDEAPPNGGLPCWPIAIGDVMRACGMRACGAAANGLATGRAAVLTVSLFALAAMAGLAGVARTAAHGLTTVPVRSVTPRSTWKGVSAGPPGVGATAAAPPAAAATAGAWPELPGPGGWEELQDRVSGRVPVSTATLEPSSLAPAPLAVRCRCCRRRSSAQAPTAATSATMVAPTAMPAMAPLLRLLLLLLLEPPPLLPPASPPPPPPPLPPPPDCSCNLELFTYRMLVGLRYCMSSAVVYLATPIVCGSGRPSQPAKGVMEGSY